MTNSGVDTGARQDTEEHRVTAQSDRIYYRMKGTAKGTSSNSNRDWIPKINPSMDRTRLELVKATGPSDATPSV